MYFSVSYFENKLKTHPRLFKRDLASIVRVTAEIVEKFKFDEVETYAELQYYYKMS